MVAVLAAGGFAIGWRGALPPPLAGWSPQAGDVVLRHGDGLWSRAFARLNRRDRHFSHAGVVIPDVDGWLVVHAEADDLGRHGRIRAEDWASFAAQARHLAVLRLSQASQQQRLAEAARRLAESGLGFDLEFRLDTPQRVYCTELVWRALHEALARDPLPSKPIIGGRPVVLVENLLLDVPELTVVLWSVSGADARLRSPGARALAAGGR